MAHLIFILLFLLQFVIFPLGISPFETPKVYVAEFIVIFLISWFVFSFSLKPVLDRRFLPLLLLFLLGLVHIFLQPASQLFFGNVFRMQGMFLFWLLLIWSALSSQIVIKTPSQRLTAILLVLQLIATIFIEGKSDGRGVGSLGEPNALAAAVTFLWPWLFFAKKEQKHRKIFLYTGIAAAAVIILFTGSRSGFIAFGIQCAFLLLIHFKQPLLRTTIMCSGLFILSFLLPFVQKQTLFENRVDVWRVAFAAGVERPILGWGIGNTEKALHETAVKINNVVRYQNVDSSHNIFLDWWVQGGIIGFSLFAYIVVNAAIRFIKRKEVLHLTLFLGLLTVLSFNPVSVVTLLQFWCLIGQSLKKFNL